MSATTISWTDITCNCVAGCAPASPGCANCYAIGMAKRIQAGLAGPQGGKPASPRQLAVVEQYRGLTKTITLNEGTPRERKVTKWTGKIGVNVEPLRGLLRVRGRKRVFIASMGDIFHKDTPRDLQLAVLAVAAVKPNLTFQLVTKRPEVMLEVFEELAKMAGANPLILGQTRGYELRQAAERIGLELPVADSFQPWPLRNVHLITSTENQATLDERVPLLLCCPAVVHGISAEPLLESLLLRRYIAPRPPGDPTPVLRWVITGGESGRKARPCDVDWIRDILRQCKVARERGAPVRPFNKQLGAVPLGVPSCPSCEGDMFEGDVCGRCGDVVEIIDGRRVLHLKDSAGAEPAEWPEDMRVQEFPDEG